MLTASCISFTKDIQPWQIQIAVESFYNQSYKNKQLIIINNYDTIVECQQIEILFHYDIAIVDRPSFSNGKALLQALQLCAGQTIVNFPLNYYHHCDRISKSIEYMNDSGAIAVAPEYKLILAQNGSVTKSQNHTNIIADLAAYKSPAYTDDYEIDYGAWWQYLLRLYEQGVDITNIDNPMAIELPSINPNISDYNNLIDRL